MGCLKLNHIEENTLLQVSHRSESLRAKSSAGINRFGYQGEYSEEDEETGFNHFEARDYDAVTGRWMAVDPHRQFYSGYLGMGNNPINGVDPDGRDWFEVDGEIVWFSVTGDFTDNAGNTYTSLGSDVIVGTHNRDAAGNEAINSATFDLYKGSVSTTGSIASLNGNTVPASFPGSNFSTLAEGIYAADFAPRTSYPDEQAVFIWRADRQSIVLPTTDGGTTQEIFLHKGNWGAETLISNGGQGSQWSEGCQTTGCGPAAETAHTIFMNAVGNDFHGVYYLRGN